MAMDLSGPAAEARPTTSVSQPHTTSTTLPAMRSGRRSLPLIVVKGLNAGTPRFDFAIDIAQPVDPSLQAGPAEAGSAFEIEREKFRGVLDVEACGLWRDRGDHDLAIPCDLAQGNPAVEQGGHDPGEILVARGPH